MTANRVQPWLDDGDLTLYHGDALDVLRSLPAGIAQTCVTSPPYWGLRDYVATGQLGLEATPTLYVENMVALFREVRRVLRDDGTLWLNLGDSYASSGKSTPQDISDRYEDYHNGRRNTRWEASVRAPTPDGLKPKDLVGIPWQVAFALQADGWYLRSDIIWSKPNPMPESVTDRPTKAHEYLFLFSKQPRYFYDADAIREPNMLADTGRYRRSVWTIPTQPFPEAHFATYPEELVRPCILAGSAIGDLVLDPFIGSGTTSLVARKHGRRSLGIDLSEEYLAIAAKRTQQLSLLGGVA